MGKGIVDQLKKEFQLDVTWVPFEIHPDTPPEGVLLSEKFHHVDLSAMFEGLNQSGKPYDIHFNRIERLYNSRAALEVSEFARDKGVYDQIHNRLFSAYFQEGKNIGDPELLYGIAEKFGLNKNDIAEALEEGIYMDRLQSGLDEGRKKGVSAVPTFFFSDNQALTGAQPLEMFKSILTGETNTSPIQPL